MIALFGGFSALEDLVRELARASEVFTSKKAGDDFFWQRHLTDGPPAPALPPYRAVQPSQILPVPIPADRRGLPGPSVGSPRTERPTILWGAKSCDLRSLAVMDHVFLNGDFRDPFYAERRQNTLVIASDCTGYRPSCFCVALGINPFPEGTTISVFQRSPGGASWHPAAPKAKRF